MSERCYLNLKYAVVGPSVRAAVTDLLRYMDRREWNPAGTDPEPAALATYLPGPSRRLTRGPLFDAYGPAGEPQRRYLASFVARSVERVTPLRPRGPDGTVKDHRRAYYHAIVSPERSGGLDLRLLTRQLMIGLQEEAGSLPPWLGAEHRDTAHHHVHLLLPARRETSAGRFQALVISRRQFHLMRAMLGREIERQRANPRLWAPQPADRPPPTRGMGDLLGMDPHVLMSAWGLDRTGDGARERGEAERARRTERETEEWER